MTKPDSMAYPPRGMSRDEAARYIGVGTTTFDGLLADGRMPKPMRLGKRMIWDHLKVEAAFADLDEGSRDNFFDGGLRRARSSRQETGPRRAETEQEDWARIARERGDALSRGVDPDTGAPLRRRKRATIGSARPEGGKGKG